jgi:hypothetical protein
MVITWFHSPSAATTAYSTLPCMQQQLPAAAKSFCRFHRCSSSRVERYDHQAAKRAREEFFKAGIFKVEKIERSSTRPTELVVPETGGGERREENNDYRTSKENIMV